MSIWYILQNNPGKQNHSISNIVLLILISDKSLQNVIPENIYSTISKVSC